jgi:hypothetical protein
MHISTFDLKLGQSKTSLCEFGTIFGTNKCPFIDFDPTGNLERDCNSYTPLYDLLFFPFKYTKINFGEIGIFKNASMKMWRNYFPHANLYGWDCCPTDAEEDRYKVLDFVHEAKKENLSNTTYDYMNVRDEESIKNALNKVGCKFDILMDDSDHEFWSQIRIIRLSPMHINPGGLLIIEDINHTITPRYSLESYVNCIKEYGHDKFYDSIVKINTHHDMQTDTYPNNCILVLTRNHFMG